MNEENLNSNSSGDFSAQYSSPVETSTGEKTFTQSDVNRLIGETRAETRERVRSEYENKYSSQPHVNQHVEQHTLGGMKQLTPQEIETQVNSLLDRKVEMLQKEATARQEEEYANRIVNDFVSRIQGGSQKYEDFEKRLGDLNLQKHPNLLPLSIEVDNTDDVMYELSNNRSKAFMLNLMAQMDPDAARHEMKSLSESIKQNQNAMTAKRPSAPLSRVNPSVTATDSGARTISDLRRDPKFRV